MLPGVGVEASWPLVYVGSNPHTWGGPQIKWANHRDLWAMLFNLDDTMEKREWGSVHAEVGVTVRALTTVLSSLQDIITPVGQV